MRRAIYPGSFDPVTNGHLDVIERAVKLFDEVIVAVAVNSQKQALFTFEERLAMLQQTTTAHADRLRIVRLDGLLVDYARREGRRPSCAACGRCRTLNSSSRWR